MWVVHQRLAELWLIKKKRSLTKDEQTEFVQCLDANANRAWKLARLENQYLLASMTQDKEWHHHISSELNKLS
ncbi:hypothetical protein L1765_15160 [Microaerobacter geothermalis]|nr:hypothetical protein [Microaerobacter geothermalis]